MCCISYQCWPASKTVTCLKTSIRLYIVLTYLYSKGQQLNVVIFVENVLMDYIYIAGEIYSTKWPNHLLCFRVGWSKPSKP
jgi:hypothetical protein